MSQRQTQQEVLGKGVQRCLQDLGGGNGSLARAALGGQSKEAIAEETYHSRREHRSIECSTTIISAFGQNEKCGNS